jgi:hypothetical protein
MGDSIMASIIRATTTSGLQVAPDNSGSLQLQTNGTTTAVTIDTSQNVGIGTTSPARKLDVSGASAAGGAIEIGTTNTQSSTVAAINTTGTTYSYSGVGGSTIWYYGNKTVALGTDSANPIQFISNATERMRIDSSGNVLVGTTTTRNRLTTVSGAGSNPPGLGTNGGVTFVGGDNALYGLLTGVSTSGYSWMQTQRVDGTATAYDMILQP